MSPRVCIVSTSKRTGDFYTHIERHLIAENVPHSYAVHITAFLNDKEKDPCDDAHYEIEERFFP